MWPLTAVGVEGARRWGDAVERGWTARRCWPHGVTAPGRRRAGAIVDRRARQGRAPPADCERAIETIYARRGPTSPRRDKRVASSTEPAPATHPVSWSTSTRAAALTVWPHRCVATPADPAACRESPIYHGRAGPHHRVARPWSRDAADERGPHHRVAWPWPRDTEGIAPWPALSCAARTRGLAPSTAT